jgi:hypothetical protein
MIETPLGTRFDNLIRSKPRAADYRARQASESKVILASYTMIGYFNVGCHNQTSSSSSASSSAIPPSSSSMSPSAGASAAEAFAV